MGSVAAACEVIVLLIAGPILATAASAEDAEAIPRAEIDSEKLTKALRAPEAQEHLGLRRQPPLVTGGPRLDTVVAAHKVAAHALTAQKRSPKASEGTVTGTSGQPKPLMAIASASTTSDSGAAGDSARAKLAAACAALGWRRHLWNFPSEKGAVRAPQIATILVANATRVVAFATGSCSVRNEIRCILQRTSSHLQRAQPSV